MSLSRRSFLAAGTMAGLGAADPATAAAVILDLRRTGEGDAVAARPAGQDETSRRLQAAIDKAAASGRALRLPPGRLIVSNLTLPKGARLVGVPGATVIAYGGGGHLFFAESADGIALSGLVIDGANEPLGDYAPGLVHISKCRDVVIEECRVVGPRSSAIVLDRVGGRITRNAIAGSFETAIQANESVGLDIVDNAISGSAGNAIRVWRWTAGEDGTRITGNRIEGVASEGAGGGDIGNGIDIFRASGVSVSANRIAGCSGSGVRVRAAAGTMIAGNTLTRVRGTGILLQHDADGAVINGNVVDAAANGIVLAGGGAGQLSTLSANRLRNIAASAPEADEGIGIAVIAAAAIDGNVVERAERIGIRIGFGAKLGNVTASGNVVRDAAIGIAVSVVPGGGEAAISANVISGASRGAILGMDRNLVKTGDLAGGGAVPPNLHLSGNRAG